jgi:hypothetical protein
MTEKTFTAAEKLKCAERELKQRYRVYARLVAQNKMTQRQADREIALMEDIAADYRALSEAMERATQAAQTDLFEDKS